MVRLIWVRIPVWELQLPTGQMSDSDEDDDRRIRSSLLKFAKATLDKV